MTPTLTGRVLLAEMWRTLMQARGLLAAAIGTMLLWSAWAPAFTWLGKHLVDDFAADGWDLAVVGDYVLPFLGVLAAWTVLHFVKRFFKGIYTTRMVICLQRTYLLRSDPGDGTADVARVLYDAKKAVGGLELFYEEIPQIVANIVAVFFWQVAVAPRWLPALALSVLPSLLIALVFGPWIRDASLRVLRGVTEVADATVARDADLFHARQESLYRRFVSFEVFFSGADVLLDTIFWCGPVLVIFLDHRFGLGLLPESAGLGDPVFFWGQLRLLAFPFARIGKAYNKLCSARPALLRIYRPGERHD